MKEAQRQNKENYFNRESLSNAHIADSVVNPESDKCFSEVPNKRSQSENPYHMDPAQLNPVQMKDTKTKLCMLIMTFKLSQMGFKQQEYQGPLSQIPVAQMTLARMGENITRVFERISSIRTRPATSIRMLPIQQLPENLLRSDIILRLSDRVQRPKTVIMSKNFKEVSTQPKILPKKCDPFECPVCLSPVSACILCVEIGCGHNFCDACVKQHTQAQINQGRFNVTCPMQGCLRAIPDDTVQKCHSAASHARYLKIKQRKEIEKDPNTKFCSIPDCDGYLSPRPDIQGLFCSQCEAVYCPKCLMPKHQNNCEVNLAAVQKVYTQLKIYKCPECAVPIQKASGCNHMSCPNCSYQFCWLCMGKYTSRHYRAYNIFGCPGLQFDEANRAWTSVKRVLMCIGLPFFAIIILVAIILGLPAYMVIVMFWMPCEWSKKLCQYRSGCCRAVLWMLMWFTLVPVGVLFGVTLAPIMYFQEVCKKLSQSLS